jgi:hypothetical protein
MRMRTWIYSFCCIIYMTTAVPHLEAVLNGSNDWQVWNFDVVTGNITEDVKAKVELAFYWGDDGKKLYYNHEQIEIGTKLSEHIDIWGGFREAYSLVTATDDWTNTHQFLVTSNLSWEYKDWKFIDRNRVHYRIYEDNSKSDDWLYRNRLTIKSPYMWTKYNIQPFVADEIFIQEGRGLMRNRAQVGVGMVLLDKVKGSLYYQRQSTKSGDTWKQINTIGVNVLVTF